MKKLLYIIAFILSACNGGEVIVVGPPKLDDATTPTVSDVTVHEFRPAPGQFVNKGYDATTHDEACRAAEEALKRGSFVSLGGFGGYIVVSLGRSITGDFGIMGNAHAGSSEPGVVWVSGDGETWHELAGSETDVTRGYSVTYFRPAADGDPVRWVDSEGNEDEIARISIHTQPYYPRWIAEESYTLTGTLLAPRNRIDANTGMWINEPYGWGYADNYEGGSVNRFSIPEGLASVGFIKIQTAVNACSGPLGELSTEVCGFVIY